MFESTLKVRNLMIRVVGLIWIMGHLFMPAPAQATKYAGSFMENGGGARALAMGGAFVAVADDPSAVFWNPAGIADSEKRGLMLMHSERFGDLIDRDFAAYTQPVNWSLLGGDGAGFGVSIIRLGIDDIPYTNHLADQLDDPANGGNGDGIVDDQEIMSLYQLRHLIRYESDQELALLVSYGESKGAWKIGGNLKFIHQGVGDNSAMGIGADLALLRPSIWKDLTFGIKFQDLTTTYLSWDTGRNEIIAPAIIPGLAYHFSVPAWNMGIIVAGSLESRLENRKTADQYWIGKSSANSHLGTEVSFNGKVFLRGGFDSGFASENITAGAGFVLDLLTIDYAYAGDSLDIDEVTHRISVTARF